MERLPTLERSATPQLEDFFQIWEQRMGYLPNALLTLSRKPDIVKAMAMLSKAVHNDCSLPPVVRGLVGYMASRTAQCNYCVAHTASVAVRYGVPEEMVVDMIDFETSPAYSEAVRAALRFARAASAQPSTMSDAIMADARKHFSDTQVVEIAAICGFYGWWNRINSGLQMELEEEPRTFAEENLTDGQWKLGRHGHSAEY